ncbi:MAG: efflux RND transporter periplasmic adaptor subunit [Calditrichales bacterium]|nr:efflux RND transporter periplasmic adaptor subunit [Calditrichales bacterium]
MKLIHKRTKIILLILIVLVVYLIIHFTVNRDDDPATVETIPVSRGELTSYVIAKGTITSRIMEKINSPINGVISNISQEIYVGAKVEKDQQLCVIEKSKQDLLPLLNDLKLAKIDLKLARQKVVQGEMLYKAKAISEEELESRKTALLRSRMSLEQLKNELENQVVKASFAGVITEKNVAKGQIIQSGAEIFTVVDMSVLIAELKVDEYDIARVKKGQKVLVNSEAFMFTLEGYVQEIGLVADKEDRGREMHKFPVIVSLANPEDMPLRLGGSVRAKIIIEKVEDINIIPLEAVLYENVESNDERNKKTFVFVLKDNRAKKRYIRTGLYDEKRITVNEGLDSGDVVITAGNLDIHDNDRVEVVEHVSKRGKRRF